MQLSHGAVSNTRKASCDNYFIVNWNVLNCVGRVGLMIILVSQDRERLSRVKLVIKFVVHFGLHGISLRTVLLFYDFKRFLKCVGQFWDITH